MAMELRNWCEKQGLRPLDYQFANWLSQHENRAGVLALAAQCSYQLSLGHICLPLHNKNPQWCAQLNDSPVVGNTSEQDKPLILDNGRLYLQRYFAYEVALAAALKQRQQQNTWPEADIQNALGQLFKTLNQSECDWQLMAAATAARQKLTVISGGPGTGKTTTVTKLLAVLNILHGASGHQPVIKLAAPTGKAAARLTESISAAQQQLLAANPQLKAVADIPTQAYTLHRLLGYVPGSEQFRHHQHNPLHLDILVVDEASMVDLPMMAKLLDALPQDAQLILLGDQHQLSSVEAGGVLGDICNAGARPQVYSAQHSQYLQHVSGQHLPADMQAAATAVGMADYLCHLRKSYRFHEKSGIGNAARIAREGGANALQLWRELFANENFSDIRWFELAQDKLERAQVRAICEPYRHYLQAIKEQRPAREILAAFNTYRILSPVREGALGVEGLNQQIEAQFRQEGLLKSGDWYAGRPVMIMQNDYRLGLFNGDTGIILRDSDGQLRAFFIDNQNNERWILPARLPARETVFAMTIHKSQGSEFEHTLLVMPVSNNALLNRELLYTGITRAKKQLTLYVHSDALATAMGQGTERYSGLRERLWESGIQ